MEINVIQRFNLVLPEGTRVIEVGTHTIEDEIYKKHKWFIDEFTDAKKPTVETAQDCDEDCDEDATIENEPTVEPAPRKKRGG